MVMIGPGFKLDDHLLKLVFDFLKLFHDCEKVSLLVL